MSPDGDQELGYGLVDAAHGQGLGTEAVGALCAVLELRPGVRRLTAEVLPGNEPSVRLLHRLGFVEVDGGSAPHVLLARAAPGEPPVRGRRPAGRITGRHVCRAPVRASPSTARAGDPSAAGDADPPRTCATHWSQGWRRRTASHISRACTPRRASRSS